MLTKRDRIVIDTLIPSNAHPVLKLGAFDAGFDEFEKDFSQNAVFSMKLGFWFGLFLAIWVAPLLILRLPPITLYNRETRERAFMALYNSRLYVFRQMALLLKATICFGYGANPDVRDAIGYPRQFDDPRGPLPKKGGAA